MNQVRGIIFILLGGWLIYMGWHNFTASRSIWAYAIGAAAIAIGIWRLTVKNTR